MIVKDGRSILFKYITENITENTSNLYFFVGDGTGGDTYSETKPYVNEIFAINKLTPNNIKSTNLQIMVSYTLEITQDAGKVVGSLGLIWSEEDIDDISDILALNTDTDMKLFSRISIDPIYLEQGSSGTIQYMLQF